MVNELYEEAYAEYIEACIECYNLALPIQYDEIEYGNAKSISLKYKIPLSWFLSYIKQVEEEALNLYLLRKEHEKI